MPRRVLTSAVNHQWRRLKFLLDVGDEKAFDEERALLWLSAYPLAVTYAHKLCAGRDWLEPNDLAHDVILDVMSRFRTIELTRAAFSTYLYRAIWNAMLTAVEKANREESLDQNAPVLNPGPTEQQQVDAELLKREGMELLAQMSPTEVVVFEQTARTITSKEAARRMSVSRATYYRKKKRVQLRKVRQTRRRGD